MAKTVAGVFTVPEGDELLWSAVGVGMAFIVPALQKKIGGAQYASLAPEITELVGAVTNMAIATGVSKFVSPERGNAVAIGAVGTAVLKEAVLLARRVQGGAFPGSRVARAQQSRSFGRGGMSSLMSEKPRLMLGSGRSSVGRTASAGPMRMLFTVDQSASEILNP